MPSSHDVPELVTEEMIINADLLLTNSSLAQFFLFVLFMGVNITAVKNSKHF